MLSQDGGVGGWPVGLLAGWAALRGFCSRQGRGRKEEAVSGGHLGVTVTALHSDCSWQSAGAYATGVMVTWCASAANKGYNHSHPCSAVGDDW